MPRSYSRNLPFTPSTALRGRSFVRRIKDTPAVIAMALLSIVCIALTRDRSPEIVKLTSSHILGPKRPFAQGHASTLVKAGGNTYLVAWFGGTHEKHPDVGIWLSRGDGKQWSEPIEIAKIREDAHWNPVLFKSNDKEITLYFKVGKEIDDWETWFIKSVDDGNTWSKPLELVAGDRGGRGPVRNKPIRLSNNVLIAGASNEKDKVWNAFVDRSDNNGRTWTSSPFLVLDRKEIGGEGIIQPTLWESTPGNVHMLLRSSSGFICRSDSKDYGKTWSKVYKTSLPNPNSGIDLVKLSDGKLALVYNPDNANWGERNPIKLAVSTDNGITWPVQTDIETGIPDDEFSYPAIVASGDTVSITYTWKRVNIAFWQGVVK
jgi:predicted neuraminidase